MSDATITHSAGTIIPTALAEYRAGRAAGTIPHPISNREDIDYTLRPFDLRAGSFRLVFGSAVDADAAFAALCTPQVLTLTSVARPGINMSFILVEGTEPTIEPGAAGETVVTVPFQEVAP